jgi:hypothetical protein
MLLLTFKMPVEGNGTEHKTNERKNGIKLVRRGRHRGSPNRKKSGSMARSLDLITAGEQTNISNEDKGQRTKPALTCLRLAVELHSETEMGGLVDFPNREAPRIRRR